MKYVSVDIETCGLTMKDPDHILMVAMVVDDLSNPLPLDELPKLVFFVDPRGKYRQREISGEPFALNLNAWILKELCNASGAAKYPVEFPDTIEPVVKNFLDKHFDLRKAKPSPAGKNVGSFDMRFFPAKVQNMFRHRCLDVGTMYFDPTKDKDIPDLATCKKLAKISGDVTHDALDDALDVIKCIRYKAGIK